jgi:hypothetical protein
MTKRNRELPPLIGVMLRPGWYEHAVERCELVETHISWVILTGQYAYKVKKPVDLGFLDFSTLEKRRFYCEEELRLNRRLAPAIYLEVVPITGTPQQPVLGGRGEVIEYAVKMAQFPQPAQLDRMLESGQLEPFHMDAFANMIADFHRQAAKSVAADSYGEPAQVWQPMAENFTQIRGYIADARQLESLARLERWSGEAFARLAPLLARRKAGGFVRECHGDMHLRNLAWIDNAPLAFDGIEFNPNLRWIDVISEVAFLVMDLHDRGRPELAQRFLNAYFECSGDYAGLQLLPLYLVYRAMVRAKVCAIRLGQQLPDETERASAESAFAQYLALARSYTRPTTPALLLTHGLSGSGKTSLSQPLLERLPAIRIRSDVERKRLFGMEALESGRAAPAEGIYSADAGRRTYGRLRELAAQVLDAGYTVIVDATFLQREQRESFERLARERGVRYLVLEFRAQAATLRRRIGQRRGDASDADLAVLEHQLAGHAPLTDGERARCVAIDTEAPFDPLEVVQRIRALC